MKLSEPNASARTLAIFLVDPTGAGFPGLVAAGGYTIKIRKAGGADVDPTNALVDRGLGRYELPLAAGEVDTAGLLWYYVTKPGVIRDFVDAEMIDPNVATVDATTLAAIRAGIATDAHVLAIPTNPLLTNDARLNDLDATVSSRATAALLATDLGILQAAIASVQADTDDLQARIPAALVGGKIDAHLNDVAAGALTVIAQAVWALARAGNQPAGSFGEEIDAKISTAGGGGGGATADAVVAALMAYVLDANADVNAQTFKQAINIIAAYCGGDGVGLDGLVGSIDNLAADPAKQKHRLEFEVISGKRTFTKRDGT